MAVLWIGLGSGLGGVARYLLASSLMRLVGPAFPFGTLAVNAIGSFLVVLIMHVSIATGLIPPTVRLALTTGVMGGFTTYSTFTHETIALAERGAWLLAGVNVLATVSLCLVSGALGLWAGRALAGS